MVDMEDWGSLEEGLSWINEDQSVLFELSILELKSLEHWKISSFVKKKDR